METAFYYLGLCGILTVLLWIPYILERLFSWGLISFLHNYPQGFPQEQPKQKLWAVRAQRAHLNMVETMPAFIAVVVAAALLKMNDAMVGQTVSMWAQIFFYARVLYSIVYIMAVPYIRTPVYLLSWVSVLMIGYTIL